MQRINDYALYELAGHLKQLAKYDDETPKTDVWLDARQARVALDSLLNGHPVTIEFCQDAAQNIRDCINNFFLTDDEGNDLKPFAMDEGETVDKWVFFRYRRLLREFETVFATELREMATYFVPRRGIYHTPSLVDHADNAFPIEIQPFIPDKSKEDWRSAGRCLAFSLYSASGFHVTRAVEGALEHYYREFCKPKKPTLHGWQDYIDALEKVSIPPARLKKTIAEIKQMKDDYRNPIAHPRIVLSETDARMLFDNGESVIISMASEIMDAGLAAASAAGASAAAAAAPLAAAAAAPASATS